VKLLGECLSKHTDFLSKLKYDLSAAEMMKVADISRDSCNYHDNGVFVLLVYFVKACKKL